MNACQGPPGEWGTKSSWPRDRARSVVPATRQGLGGRGTWGRTGNHSGTAGGKRAPSLPDCFRKPEGLAWAAAATRANPGLAQYACAHGLEVANGRASVRCQVPQQWPVQLAPCPEAARWLDRRGLRGSQGCPKLKWVWAPDQHQRFAPADHRKLALPRGERAAARPMQFSQHFSTCACR